MTHWRLVFGLCALPLFASAQDAGTPPPNVVQQEMQELTRAMQTVVSAVANNTLEQIPEAIHRVHSARQLTEQAIEKGEYRPPKHPEQLKAFIALDDAFHRELVKLLKAARAKDLVAATRQLGPILNGCTGCHLKYRF